LKKLKAKNGQCTVPKAKYEVGEAVEVMCGHIQDGKQVHDWLAGVVVQADHRMAAVKFDTDVYSSNGYPIQDRILWCAHGSRHIRRRSDGSEQGN
jgi:hypothetical protein